MRVVFVLPPSPGEVNKPFILRHIDCFLFAHRSDTHLEDAYSEAYRRAYEDGVTARDKIVGLHCDGPHDLYIGAVDGYEAAGCEVQLLEYVAPGQFVGRPRHPKNGCVLGFLQAELMLDVIDHRMRNVGHLTDLQNTRNHIAASLSKRKRFEQGRLPVSV